MNMIKPEQSIDLNDEARERFNTQMERSRRDASYEQAMERKRFRGENPDQDPDNSRYNANPEAALTRRKIEEMEEAKRDNWFD
jgi:hypothetical protein